MRILTGLLIVAWSVAQAASPNMELAKSVFDPRVMSNAVESPIPGLYQFAQGTEVFYISADGRYVMQGEMIDLQTQRNVTEAFRASERVKALAQLDPKTMISVSPNSPQYRVTVFVDVDCPYCRVMQQNILEYTQRGIAIRYLAFPRSGPQSVAALRMSQVWCSADRLSALLLAETDQPLPNSRGDCNDVIHQHFTTGLQIGVASTPSVILEDGTLIPGFVAPANLEAILNQHRREHYEEMRSPLRLPPGHPANKPPSPLTPLLEGNIPTPTLTLLTALDEQLASHPLKQLEERAEQGDADAQYRLGIEFAGEAGAQHAETARYWLEKAAAQNNADAAFKLGLMHDEGEGTARDHAKAETYYRQALAQWQQEAASGNADAQYKLGVMYREGLGVAADAAQARSWFEKAAMQGNSMAKAALE